jgi:hypothetical protein
VPKPKSAGGGLLRATVEPRIVAATATRHEAEHQQLLAPLPPEEPSGPPHHRTPRRDAAPVGASLRGRCGAHSIGW